jgi:hypothetical protein
MAIVTWVKCDQGLWCSFDRVNLTKVSTVGVYVIWHTGSPGRVVRVGQGDIAQRLGAHRDDPAVTRYRTNGSLLVTWAEVPKKADRDGIERYLANHYRPLVGDAWPDVTPIPVNLPGQ